MNKLTLSRTIFMMIAMVLTLSSCEAIGSIFKAGVWFGVIGIIVVVAIIFWLISKARK